MKTEKRQKQLLLRISFAVTLLVVALAVEFIGMHPTGIYDYQIKGYKAFHIGLPKQAVLRQINLTKTIRQVRTCEPESISIKDSRKKLVLSSAMAAADIWISHDRTGKDFLFIFKDDVLDRVLLQRLRFGKKPGSELFRNCGAIRPGDLDSYLKTKETLKVYPEKATPVRGDKGAGPTE